MMSTFLLPVISIPTKINTVNDILIDHIFTNEFNPDLIPGNFIEDISDHLPYTGNLNKVDHEFFFWIY